MASDDLALGTLRVELDEDSLSVPDDLGQDLVERSHRASLDSGRLGSPIARGEVVDRRKTIIAVDVQATSSRRLAQGQVPYIPEGIERCAANQLLERTPLRLERHDAFPVTHRADVVDVLTSIRSHIEHKVHRPNNQ